MAGLREDFEHFYPLDGDDVKMAIVPGLITPDTNVLLNLYRFQGEGREQLSGLLEKLDNRLWIPYQVGLEFHRLRLNVIGEKEAYLKTVLRDIDGRIKGLRDKVDEFGTMIALDSDRIESMKNEIKTLRDSLAAEVNRAQKANDVRLTEHDADPVLARLEVLFNNRVGEQMKPKALMRARKEAKRRVAERIPPGYEDAGKLDPTGDYLIFRQLMKEAKKRELPVVFVADDEKPDWYRREGYLSLGARHELREEMMAEAGVRFVIMTTVDFLVNAKEYLEVEVSPETVDQAKEIPGIVENESYLRNDVVQVLWGPTPTES